MSYLDDSISLDVRVCHRAGWLADGARFEWRTLTASRAAGRDQKRWLMVMSEALIGVDTATQGRCDGDSLTLFYPCELGRETIDLTYTDAQYGGERPWFLCPGEKRGAQSLSAGKCGKRVALLYWTGTCLRCRHCAGVAYRSQSEAPYRRGLRAATKSYTRASTLWSLLHDDFVDVMPPRPKGMHRVTYEALCAVHKARFAEWEKQIAVKQAQLAADVANLQRKV